MAHLTIPQIKSYIRLEPEVDEMLLFDEHLADCAECKSQMARLSANEQNIQRLRSDLRIEEPHLQFEDLSLLAQGGAASPRVKAHLAVCKACLAEVDQLRADNLLPMPSDAAFDVRRRHGWFRSHDPALPLFQASCTACL